MVTPLSAALFFCILSSSSFINHALQNMSNQLASLALRRASRTKPSPYFSSAANQRDSTSAYFAASNAVSDDGTFDTTPTRNKRSVNKVKTLSSNKKQKASSSKQAVIERTESFEPAWWGNVLVDKTQSTLVTKNKSIVPSKANYPPIHTLILGTHPSIASLSTNQFYGHPLNAFWYLVGDSLGFRRGSAISPTTNKPYVNFYNHLRYGMDEIIEYDEQLETLVSKGFALWDIVRECERKGSLDTDIDKETPNPIREFCENRGSVKRIVIANGTTGSKFFIKHFKDWFKDGGLVAAGDEMSQRVFKTAMSIAQKANRKEIDEPNNTHTIEVVCLPGVSPAAAKFSYLEKRDAWERGCFHPGLADYESWNRANASSNVSPAKTVTKKAQNVTPSPLDRPKRAMSTDMDKSVKKRTNKESSTVTTKSAVAFLSSDIATLSPENIWADLNVPPEELRPSATLTNGQCFNWMVVYIDNRIESPTKQSAWGTHDAKEWVGPLGNRVISIRETPTSTLYRVLYGPTEGIREDLRKYFCLEIPLAPLYKEWSKADTRLARIAAVIPGCRILRQDPIECIFSFICSSNNNIPRITKILTSFREMYGQFLMNVPTQNGDDYSIYSFPTLTSLSSANEEELRTMGLGYRAKYIIETRDLLSKLGGRDFLINLRSETDSQIVQDELLQFSGIGRKVADCVALFSLDQIDAIPVDVHVQHIASRDYDPTVLGNAKSITPTIYKQVGDLFRTRFSSYAGWAHSLLFVGELPSFRGVLPADIVQQMDEWREHEQKRKQELKSKKKNQ